MRKMMTTTVPEIRLASDLRRIGSIPGCVAIGSCDIGRSDRLGCYTTWGRNIEGEMVGWFQRCTAYELVRTEAGFCEVVLPDDIAEGLLSA